MCTMYELCAGFDTIPHFLLVIMIARISGVLGVLTVRPGLHPIELRFRLVRPHGINKCGEPWFVTTADTTIMTRLLQRDHVIFPVPQGLP